MEMIRCAVDSDPIIKTTGMGLLVVFNHLRLEREELLTKRANNCEVHRPSSVEVLRVDVLGQIILRREGPGEAQVASERSDIEMSPKIINSMKASSGFKGIASQLTFCV